MKVGDAVFGVCDAGQEGAYAEKLSIKAAIVAKKPDALSHIEAAALALIGLTALVSVEDTFSTIYGSLGKRTPASEHLMSEGILTEEKDKEYADAAKREVN